MRQQQVSLFAGRQVQHYHREAVYLVSSLAVSLYIAEPVNRLWLDSEQTQSLCLIERRSHILNMFVDCTWSLMLYSLFCMRVLNLATPGGTKKLLSINKFLRHRKSKQSSQRKTSAPCAAHLITFCGFNFMINYLLWVPLERSKLSRCQKFWSVKEFRPLASQYTQ